MFLRVTPNGLAASSKEALRVFNSHHPRCSWVSGPMIHDGKILTFADMGLNPILPIVFQVFSESPIHCVLPCAVM